MDGVEQIRPRPKAGNSMLSSIVVAPGAGCATQLLSNCPQPMASNVAIDTNAESGLCLSTKLDDFHLPSFQIITCPIILHFISFLSS